MHLSKYSSSNKIYLLVIFLLQFLVCVTKAELSLSPNSLYVLRGEEKIVNLVLKGDYEEDIVLNINPNHEGYVDIQPREILIDKDDKTDPKEYEIKLYGIELGHIDVSVNSSLSIIDTKKAFVKVTILNSYPILYTSITVGWIYFVAWSISFYPQIYINFKRKSVVGLNFDFIALNLVGFMLYSLFNLGLYFIPSVQEEYARRFPTGLNPIQVNDIVFALHAAAATIFTIFQCFIYERENQRVSITARVLLGVFGIVIIVTLILSATDVVTWLDFLYYCSYIKLFITLIKYVPQAYMNYRRKSTVGWSIGNIFLDFTGGMLSMLQMILNAFNYDDWVSIFGDPTKFGLGLFSVLFDIFFIIQHYVLYRNALPYSEINGENIPRTNSNEIDENGENAMNYGTEDINEE